MKKWSTFLALESSLLLEYHSTNLHYWTYTSFRQLGETDCGDERKHATKSDNETVTMSETRIRDETVTSPTGQGTSVLSSIPKTAFGPASKTGLSSTSAGADTSLATSVSSKASSDSAASGSAVASAIATTNAGASNSVFMTYAAAALAAFALL